MNFTYRAKSSSGTVTTGVIEAASPADARRQLRERDLFTLSLNEEGRRGGGASTARTTSRGSKISKTDLLMFTTQLSIMCKSGIDLAEAFKNVAADCKKPALRNVILGIYDDVASGSSVSAAMQKRADVFGEPYVASIAAGEASGRVPEVLHQLSELLKNEIRLRNTLRGVLAYPCVLIGVAVLVMAALVFFVLPQFGNVFETLEAPAPAMTQFLVDGAAALRTHWLFVLVGIGLVVIGAVTYSRTEHCRLAIDHLLLNSRFFKTATRPLLTGRSFRLIGTMLESGLPLLEAIQLARRSTPNTQFRAVFDRMEAEILQGHGISGCLRETDVIPTGAVQLVSTAERTGRLGPVMQLVGEFYEDEGEREIRQRAKVLEPLIIVFMGGIVAVVVASVMLPLLDVSSSAPH